MDRKEHTAFQSMYNDCIAARQPHKMCVMRFDLMRCDVCVRVNKHYHRLKCISKTNDSKDTATVALSINSSPHKHTHTIMRHSVQFSALHKFLCYLIPFYWPSIYNVTRVSASRVR